MPERARAAIERLRPSNPDAGTQQVTAAAWRDIPATYVRCRYDRLPELLSSDFAASADVVEVPTGHCPNWSDPPLVADLLARTPSRVC